MVQRLPDPTMLPTSQEAGGMVHDNRLAMTAPGTAPGFDGGSYAYPASTDLPPASPPPGQSGPTIPVPTQPVSSTGTKTGGPYPDLGSTSQPRVPAGSGPTGGQWTADVQGPGGEGPWKKTPSAGSPA